MERSGTAPNPRLQRTPLRAPLSRKPLGGTLVLLCLLALPASFGFSYAQDLAPQPGFVTARVLDPSDMALPGVQVTVKEVTQTKAVVGSGVTNAKGIARIGPLIPGTYEVVAELMGMRADYSVLVAVVRERPSSVVVTMSIWLSGGDRFGPEETVAPTPTRALPMGRGLAFFWVGPK